MQWLAQKEKEEEEGGMVKDTARALGQDGLACRPPDLLGSPGLDEQRASGRERRGVGGRERQNRIANLICFLGGRCRCRSGEFAKSRPISN